MKASGKAPSALCSQRWSLAVLAFFGCLFVYVVRVNISVAIICMVRTPRNNHTHTYYDVNSSVGKMPDHLQRSGSAGTSLLGGFPEQGENVSEVSEADSREWTWEDDEEQACGEDVLQDTTARSHQGEFDWDKITRSRLLAMYFYGYVITQLPGGWLASRYGGRRVWGVCQAVCALCTLLTPLAARTNVYLVYALRFLLGLGAGVSFPCLHAMMGRWAPRLERSRLISFASSGMSIGTILTFSLSALLCAYGFDNGWGSIFYLAGAGNVLWVVVWFFFTADTPAGHKRISTVERDYILTSIGDTPADKEKFSTPWRAIFTSGPVWAIIFAHMFNNYTTYTLMTSLPTFMKEALKFDIKRNGALSSLPYICEAISSVLFGQLADFVRVRGYLSTKNTRKVMQITSFTGGAACISLAGFLTCHQRALSVFVLCLCLTFLGLNRSGYSCNHIDLAPRHAGVLFGISNTAATIPGMIAPIVAGTLTPNSSPEEWRRVFFICAGMAGLGALLYGWLADGEQQSWAAPPPVDSHIDVTMDDLSRVDTSMRETSELKTPHCISAKSSQETQE